MNLEKMAAEIIKKFDAGDEFPYSAHEFIDKHLRNVHPDQMNTIKTRIKLKDLYMQRELYREVEIKPEEKDKLEFSIVVNSITARFTSFSEKYRCHEILQEYFYSLNNDVPFVVNKVALDAALDSRVTNRLWRNYIQNPRYKFGDVVSCKYAPSSRLPHPQPQISYLNENQKKYLNKIWNTYLLTSQNEVDLVSQEDTFMVLDAPKIPPLSVEGGKLYTCVSLTKGNHATGLKIHLLYDMIMKKV